MRGGGGLTTIFDIPNMGGGILTVAVKGNRPWGFFNWKRFDGSSSFSHVVLFRFFNNEWGQRC